MILNEYDKNKSAVINPSNTFEKRSDFPKIGVSCFSNLLLEGIINKLGYEVIEYLDVPSGKIPIYKVNYKGVDIAMWTSRVGAPAAVISYEEVIALGLQKFIAFGTCGTLDNTLNELSIIIPTSAIRDEGLSYHYQEASDEIEVNEKYKEEFINILEEHNYSYVSGKTWTTDALYRETKEKVERRKASGAICVEMECSALAAVSKFRNVDFFEFFYVADNLDNSVWDERNLSCIKDLDQKEKIGMLALEFAINISNK